MVRAWNRNVGEGCPRRADPKAQTKNVRRRATRRGWLLAAMVHPRGRGRARIAGQRRSGSRPPTPPMEARRRTAGPTAARMQAGVRRIPAPCAAMGRQRRPHTRRFAEVVGLLLLVGPRPTEAARAGPPARRENRRQTPSAAAPSGTAGCRCSRAARLGQTACRPPSARLSDAPPKRAPDADGASPTLHRRKDGPTGRWTRRQQAQPGRQHGRCVVPQRGRKEDALLLLHRWRQRRRPAAAAATAECTTTRCFGVGHTGQRPSLAAVGESQRQWTPRPHRRHRRSCCRHCRALFGCSRAR